MRRGRRLIPRHVSHLVDTRKVTQMCEPPSEITWHFYTDRQQNEMISRETEGRAACILSSFSPNTLDTETGKCLEKLEWCHTPSMDLHSSEHPFGNQFCLKSEFRQCLSSFGIHSVFLPAAQPAAGLVAAFHHCTTL